MTSPSAATARAFRIASQDPLEVVQVELYAHGPQWQRRVRLSIGPPGRLVGHGQMFCSVEMAGLLINAMLGSGRQVRVIDRSGPEPVFYRSTDGQAHADERRTPREEQ